MVTALQNAIYTKTGLVICSGLHSSSLGNEGSYTIEARYPIVTHSYPKTLIEFYQQQRDMVINTFLNLGFKSITPRVLIMF